MNTRLYTILLATALLFVAASGAYASGRKKKKTHRGAEIEDMLLIDMPIPDAPLPPLQPQARVSPERQPSHQHEHRLSRRGNGGGIDVSHYQGDIDWWEVARQGDISYVYLKATEGANLIDNTFRRNLSGARRAGLKVGIYHFYRPNVSVQEQFVNLTSNVALRDMDLLPIIDVENRGRASLESFRAQLMQFINMVERHYGCRPIIYTSRDFYNKYLAGPFTGYKYMIARYHTDIPELIDDAKFVMWQYTASGRVRGIRGNVDRSCFMDDYSLRDIVMERGRER